MKIKNVSIFMGDDTLRARHGEKSNTSGKADKKTIDGSTLQSKFDSIAAKKEQARKKAMKIVGDTFANEQKIDDDLNARRERVRSLQKDLGDANRAIKEMEDSRASLRDAYGVDEDSQEETDLKLLEKQIRARMPGSDVHLSKDEIDTIKKIKENGLSEYQQRSLEMLESEIPYANTAYEADKEIRSENRIISATRLEKLKSHAMVDAEKEADAIMEAASEEIVSMLVDEAKEHMDKELEEQKEKAEEEKEKEEEIQERIDSAKEKKKENEELTEDILEGVAEAEADISDLTDAQQEIKDMMNKMKLIEDDIKGAAVDQSV